MLRDAIRILGSGTRWAILLSLCLVGCLSLCLVGCQPGGGGPEITVVYPSAAGLVVGSDVRMSDFAIGKVEGIELEPDGQVAVRIRLKEKYGTYVTEGSVFRIRRDGLLSADRYIEMQPGEGAPVGEGARLLGELPLEDRLTSLGKRLIESAGDADLKRQLEEYTAAAERAAKAGKEEWEARRPELEAEARALLDTLQKEGGQAADRLRTRIEEYIEELEQQEAPSEEAPARDGARTI